MKVLVVEDDKSVAGFVRKGLQELGHTVDVCCDGKQGLYMATSESYDVMVLDRMLPGIDGLTIVRTIRASSISTPVLILSALGEVDDRVLGLKAGGDDYLVKPFAFAELAARLEVLCRRPAGRPETSSVLQAADLSMDLLSRKVYRAGKEIELRSREFLLLEYLLRHKGQLVTRTMLLEKVWDYHFDPQTNVIDVHISRLRQKIDKNFEVQLIKTVVGSGYMIEEE